MRLTALTLMALLALGTLGAPAAMAQTNAWPAGTGQAVVDMAFDEAPLAQVFQSLADVAGLNVLLDPIVTGKVSFSLRDIAAADAIELVARITGYQYQVVGNTLIVASEDRLRQQFRTTDYELMPVRNVDLQRTADLVQQLYPDVNVIADVATDTLIVRGSAAELGGVRAFLERYDRNYTQPLQFRNASVESVLWALADRAGWNLVVEGALDGELTAHLEGMEYTHALGLVSDAADLHYRLSDNVLYVRQLQPALEQAPRRRIAIYRLDHVNPAKTGEMLAGLYPDLHVNVDEQTRSVIVEGEDAQVAAVDRFVRELDVPRRQVIVEARLEEINVDALHRLGIDWGEQRGLFNPTNIDPLVLAWDPSVLRGRLEALNDEGLSKILASPKLAAIDGEPATILIGDRIPIIMHSTDDEGRISETLEFIEAGIKLDILAMIGQDDSVTLTIDTEVSSITGMTPQNVPQIRTREMSTRVRVHDGQSLVIGGLIEEDERESMRGMPFLSDLPLVGRLFSSKTRETVQTEMVVFLIPHIVHDTPPPVRQGAGAGGGSAATAPTNEPRSRTGTASVSGAASGSVVTGTATGSGTDTGTGSGTTATVTGSDTVAAHPAHRAPGSVVADAERPMPVAEDVSIAWVDVTSHMQGAHDIQFERRRQNSGLLTGVYIASRPGGLAYGGNVAMRRYGAEIAGITPWAGLGIEYMQPAGTDGGYLVSANVGVGTREAAPLRIEVYGEYTLLETGLSLPSPDLPARSDDIRTGLRLGWEY